MWLTFDWDDVSLEQPLVKGAMKELLNIFGYGNVWYRVSSSGTGLHLVIANLKWNKETSQSFLSPQDFADKQIMEFRQRFADEPWNLECNGRMATDTLRQQSGTTWGRVFTVKNGQKSGEWFPVK